MIYESAHEWYEYYPLTVRGTFALLPQEHEIALNMVTGLTILINWEEHLILTSCTFTDEEMPLISTLLAYWPLHVPFIKLFAKSSNETPRTLTARFLEAQKNDNLDNLLAPLHTRLQACQKRMNRLGLAIVTISEVGYFLIKQVATEGNTPGIQVELRKEL